MKPEPGFETLCAHWAESPSAYRGAVIPPIFQNSLFTAPDCEARESLSPVLWGPNPEAGPGGLPPQRYDYTRLGNPTTDIVEAKIAALERGERARCFGSGMAAISASILSCVRAGGHVVAPDTVYGPTRQFLMDYLARFDIGVTFVDGSEPADYQSAMRPNTTLLYLESPSSVVFKQQDLASIARLASERGAATICDNSWATPYFQNPLTLGVDLVVHSATKYLGGHSDIVAGVAVGSAGRIEALTLQEGCLLGGILDPFAAWLLLRGLRTLGLRMDRHQQSALRVAAFLEGHPAVAAVFYPGLSSDPQSALTARQLRGTSGLLSLALRRPGREAVHRFVNHLRYFGIGCSWGGFESLAIPTALPSNALPRSRGARTYPAADAEELCWMTRLHIGLETCDDLIQDLADGLESL